jgi:hypothetical protein
VKLGTIPRARNVRLKNSPQVPGSLCRGIFLAVGLGVNWRSEFTNLLIHTLSKPAIFWFSAKNSAGLLIWSTSPLAVNFTGDFGMWLRTAAACGVGPRP